MHCTFLASGIKGPQMLMNILVSISPNNGNNKNANQEVHKAWKFFAVFVCSQLAQLSQKFSLRRNKLIACKRYWEVPVAIDEADFIAGYTNTIAQRVIRIQVLLCVLLALLNILYLNLTHTFFLVRFCLRNPSIIAGCHGNTKKPTN